jgi:hypothetical protein
MNAPTGPVGGNTTISQRHQGLEYAMLLHMVCGLGSVDCLMAEKWTMSYPSGASGWQNHATTEASGLGKRLRPSEHNDTEAAIWEPSLNWTSNTETKRAVGATSSSNGRSQRASRSF